MIAPSARASVNGRPEVAKTRTAQRLVRRNRWLIIGGPLVKLAATALFVAGAPPVYETTASLRLDKERSNLAVLDALQELSTGSEINTEMAELRSRSLAERVVSDLSLHAELVHPAGLRGQLQRAKPAPPSSWAIRG